MDDGAEVSSRRQNLQDELRRVKATVSSLDSHIDGLKSELGWSLSASDDASDGTAQMWRTVVMQSPIKEAYRELSATRPKGNKARGTTRVRGRLAETPVATGTVGAKRTRVVSAKEKRIENIWSQCGSILSSLKKHRYAWPFLQPVDAEALNIPDYYEVIRQPMDLGTISRRMEHDSRRGRYRQYTTPLEFRDDVRRVWSNCRTYNKPGQDVRFMGDALSETWEKKWCQAEIESRWAHEQETPEEVRGMHDHRRHCCFWRCLLRRKNRGG